MKHLIVALFISAALVVSAAGEATVALTNDITVTANETVVTANVTLKDGSSVKGEFYTERITGSTAFMEKLKLDPAIVKSLAFAGTNGESKVELINGDKFAMTIADESFAIKSLLGDLNIPRNNFRALSLYARKVSSNGIDTGLVFYCTFDDEAAIASPVVGQPVKLELGQLCPDKGKAGGALFVKPGIAGAEVQLPQGALGAEGCIEFWANLASGKTEFSTGGDPRFFIAFDSNGSEKGNFEFASNDGGGNSGICGTVCGVHAYSNRGYNYMMPYSDIFKGEDYNGWHHYAFVWTQTSLAIFIDGREACRATGNVITQEIANTAVTLDIPLNRTTGKSFNNKSAFFMDELKIWNFAKTSFDL